MLSTLLAALATFALFKVNMSLKVSTRRGSKVTLDLGVLTKADRSK